ncbi:hypothetical protein ABZT48_00595 [Streptomyces avermitilis]|uniref:hypothetical protein n=1 Tax=Streptomyces avermitilis TaxID=33903 RepID=UPI0033B30A28
MYTRGRTLKFAAVLAIVVLALTGFSRGRGHGGSHSGGGGGCSSSSQNHDSSSSSTSGGGSYSSGSTTSGSGSDDSYDDSYDDSDDDSYGSSSSSSGGSSGGSTYNRRPTHRSNPTSSSGGGNESLKDGTARVVSCATKKAPYATVEVENPNARKGTFWITVTFKDKDDLEVVDHYADVTVPAKGKATVDVEVGGAGLVDYVDHCEVDPVAEWSS